MDAAVLAVGSELLSTDRLDTNSLALAGIMERYGVRLVAKAVVGDDPDRIVGTLSHLLERADLVVVTGGLGPTADDVTRQAVARALGRGLSVDPGVLEGIRHKFASFGLEMPEVNRRQAEVPDGARLIPNQRGTAPGLILDDESVTVFLLPGVPGEMQGMIDSHLEPWIRERSSGEISEMRTLRIACLPESEVEKRIAPVYEELGRERIAILARPGEIRLRFTATGGDEERRSQLGEIETRLRGLVGPAVYAVGEDTSLEEVVGELLAERSMTIATAESCTGGLIAERLTRVAGSSRYFVGAAVTYTNRLKRDLLGVAGEDLEAHGAVSGPVACAMARGVRHRLDTDFGIGVTGIAGPDGGSETKPVGTVHLALAGPEAAGDLVVEHRMARFPGDRDRVRWQTAQLALDMLRRHLLRSAAGDAGAAA